MTNPIQYTAPAGSGFTMNEQTRKQTVDKIIENIAHNQITDALRTFRSLNEELAQILEFHWETVQQEHHSGRLNSDKLNREINFLVNRLLTDLEHYNNYDRNN